jgi:aspartyl-tRNA synthetase
MKRTLIRELATSIGQTVTIKGWISVRRDQGKMVFFDIRDRSGIVQAVVLPKSAAIEVAKETGLEYVVSVEGTVNERPEKNRNPKTPNGSIELEVHALSILAPSEPLPFDMSLDGFNLDLTTELDHRALRP